MATVAILGRTQEINEGRLSTMTSSDEKGRVGVEFVFEHGATVRVYLNALEALDMIHYAERAVWRTLVAKA